MQAPAIYLICLITSQNDTAPKPTGIHTCGFCVMLASRGFAYKTKESAGYSAFAFNSFHRFCDCKVIPNTEDGSVEGYDPDHLYDVYLNARKTIEGYAEDKWWSMSESEQNAYGSYSKWITNHIVNEINTRAPEWVYRGEPAKVIYEKGKELLTENEKQGIFALQNNGIGLSVQKEDPKAKANIDLLFGSMPWEMKNISNAGSSISNQLGRVRKKFYKLQQNKVRAVFTCEGCNDTIKEIYDSLLRRKRDNEEFLIIYNKTLYRIK